MVVARRRGRRRRQAVARPYGRSRPYSGWCGGRGGIGRGGGPPGLVPGRGGMGLGGRFMPGGGPPGRGPGGRCIPGAGGIWRGGRCTPGLGAGRGLGGRCTPGRGAGRGGAGRTAGPLPGPGPPRLGGGPGFAIAADASMSSASIADISFFIFLSPFSIYRFSAVLSFFAGFARRAAVLRPSGPPALRRVSSARRGRSFSPRGFPSMWRRVSGSARGSLRRLRALYRRAW